MATIINGLSYAFDPAALTFEYKLPADQTVSLLSSILNRQEILEDQLRFSTRQSPNQSNETVALSYSVQRTRTLNNRFGNGQRSFLSRNTPYRFPGRCNYCDICGHKSTNSRKSSANNRHQQKHLNNFNDRSAHRFNCRNRQNENLDKRPVQHNSRPKNFDANFTVEMSFMSSLTMNSQLGKIMMRVIHMREWLR